jgi:hypothetical protein
MPSIEITSLLPVADRDELERITFFNPEQGQVADSVVAAVHDFGVPTIVEDQGHLRFRVPAFGTVQSLYALARRGTRAELAGVVIFVRESSESILVLHLAVHEDYTAHGRFASAWVTPHLMAAVRGVALRTHGVHALRFLYPHKARLALAHAPDQPAGGLPTTEAA